MKGTRRFGLVAVAVLALVASGVTVALAEEWVAPAPVAAGPSDGQLPPDFTAGSPGEEGDELLGGDEGAGEEAGESGDAADEAAGAGAEVDENLLEWINHGAYVSSVARSATTEEYGNHGEMVSEAARSDLGKSKGGDDGEEAGADDGEEADTDDDTVSADAAAAD